MVNSSSSSLKRSRRPTAKAAVPPTNSPSSSSSTKKVKLTVRPPTDERSAAPLDAVLVRSSPPVEHLTQPTQLLSDIKPTRFIDKDGNPLGPTAEEVVEDSDNDVTVVPIATLAEVTLKSAWKVVYKRNNVANDLKTFVGNVSWWQEGKDWSRGFGGYNSICNRVALTVWHGGMKKKADWLLIDAGSEEQFDVVKEQVLKWWNQGYKDIHVDAVFHVVDEQLSPYTAGKGHSSATQRQLASLPAVQQQLNETGQHVDLRASWPCNQQRCDNYEKGKYCYWIGSDSPDNHFPITTTVGQAWSDDIRRKGGSTIKVPKPEVMNLLVKARDQLRLQAHKRRPRIPTGSPAAATQSQQQLVQPSAPNQFFFAGYPFQPGTQGAALSPLPVAEHRAEEPPSSPPTETATIDRLLQFFEWCKLRPDWQAEELQLDNMHDAIAEAGYDLRGLAAMELNDWLGLSLKVGHYSRVQRALKAWRLSRSLATKSSSSTSSSTSKEGVDSAN